MQTVYDQKIFEPAAEKREVFRYGIDIPTMPAYEVRLGRIFFFGGLAVSALMLLGIYSLGYSL